MEKLSEQERKSVFYTKLKAVLIYSNAKDQKAKIAEFQGAKSDYQGAVKCQLFLKTDKNKI